MNDLYREILIQRETPAANKLMKGGLICLTVICLVGGILFHPLLLLAGIVLGAVSWIFVFPRLEVEYEYLYVNGSLDIDAIYSRQKRKKAAGYEIEELEILAPSGSHALDSYMNRNIKVKDFTSGNPQQKNYTLVFNKDKAQEIVKVELDEIILNDIRRLAPRKVNLI